MALSEDEKKQQVFMGLVSMLGENCMFAMGKIAPPDGSEPQLQLPLAQAMIDMLGVLEERTKGNLSDREARWIGAQLTSLRLTFLETAKSAGAAGGHVHGPGCSHDEAGDEDDEDDDQE